MKARTAKTTKRTEFPDSNAWLVARILAIFGIRDAETFILQTKMTRELQTHSRADHARLGARNSHGPRPGDRNRRGHPSLGGDRAPLGQGPRVVHLLFNSTGKPRKGESQSSGGELKLGEIMPTKKSRSVRVRDSPGQAQSGGNCEPPFSHLCSGMVTAQRTPPTYTNA